MSYLPITSLDDVDFQFENSSIKIRVLRNIRELKVGGLNLPPLEEGEELEVGYWIASKLVSAGLASISGDGLLNFNQLYKLHWKETKLQVGRRMSSLPEYFYPRVRRYLAELKEKAEKDASRVSEYNNALRMTHDIVNCRLKKIVSLSASPTQTEEVLQSLSVEERILYDTLRPTISEWRSKVFRVGALR